MDKHLAPYAVSLKQDGLLYDASRQPGQQDEGFSPYHADEALIRSINMAAFLRRPLLLMGEPGCGKTVVAQHVAFNLGHRLRIWPVKSTSKAQEGLYSFDAVARLRDGQMVANKVLDGDEWVQKVRDPKNYRRFGPLGEAMVETGQRYVVLIDEIDKADLDFPNDLLRELDRGGFTIEETDENVPSPPCPPLIIITSNREKELPEPFLRRCVFHFITFPDSARLEKIVRLHMPNIPESLAGVLVERFYSLHQRMVGTGVERGGKAASTSELLDWLRVLCHPFLDQREKERWSQHETAILGQLEAGLPYPEVLLKTERDRADYLKGDHATYTP